MPDMGNTVDSQIEDAFINPCLTSERVTYNDRLRPGLKIPCPAQVPGGPGGGLEREIPRIRGP